MKERQKYSNQILSVIKLETYKVLSFPKKQWKQRIKGWEN